MLRTSAAVESDQFLTTESAAPAIPTIIYGFGFGDDDAVRHLDAVAVCRPADHVLRLQIKKKKWRAVIANSTMSVWIMGITYNDRHDSIQYDAISYCFHPGYLVSLTLVSTSDDCSGRHVALNHLGILVHCLAIMHYCRH